MTLEGSNLLKPIVGSTFGILDTAVLLMDTFPPYTIRITYSVRRKKKHRVTLLKLPIIGYDFLKIIYNSFMSV